MKKIMMIFGTRPEAIKMIPLIKELNKRKNICLEICVSGQHRELLSSVLETYGIVPDYDLEIMREGQSLFDITSLILNKIEKVLKKSCPDIVLVHGDTSTAFSAALGSFYLKIPVCHIEAGLRTYNMYSPYPEEFNRRAISLIATWHFAPTDSAKENLLRDGIDKDKIFVTGNTAVDAVMQNISEKYEHKELELSKNKKLILLTMHRRETPAEIFKGILNSVWRIVEEREDVRVLFPVHPNPKVRGYVKEIFKQGNEDISLCEPLNSFDFHNIMARSYLVITDSGGVQEEAPALGIPVLLVRDTTERPEGIKCGSVKIVGTNETDVYNNLNTILDDPQIHKCMSESICPFGDGKASERISDILERVILE